MKKAYVSASIVICLPQANDILTESAVSKLIGEEYGNSDIVNWSDFRWK